jgi:ketosteroid isomerase-like protein
MWSERISVVRAFTDAVTERNLDAALDEIDATWEEWRVEVEQLSAAPDGCVVIVMSTHMRGKGSGLPFAQRVAALWEFKDEKLWRGTLYRDPADAVRATGAN